MFLEHVGEHAERTPGEHPAMGIAGVQQLHEGRGVADHPVLRREQHGHLVGAGALLDLRLIGRRLGFHAEVEPVEDHCGLELSGEVTELATVQSVGPGRFPVGH